MASETLIVTFAVERGVGKVGNYVLLKGSKYYMFDYRTNSFSSVSLLIQQFNYVVEG